jgi:hypothetical protein
MAFAKVGAGVLLAGTFDHAFADDWLAANLRGRSLLIATDIGGSHAGQLFETYSFLVTDLDRNAEWLSAQGAFRMHMLRSSRRMAFKALNDKVRRRVLRTFLQIGSQIHGWLITFAISKNGVSFFEPGPYDPEIVEKLRGWKRPVQERLLRVLHLSAFLISGLSMPKQDILWIIDQDEVASNVEQLTQLTSLLGTVVSHSLTHDLGHIRCATANIDNGTRSIEDLLSYCDLAAGAISEATTTMAGGHRYLQEHIVAPLPSEVSWKARTILSWLAATSGNLRQLTCLIELGCDSPAIRSQLLRWHAFRGAA